MLVLSDICGKCNNICNSIYFQRNFKYWTSGINDVDEFIQNTQLSAHDYASDALEWVPYDRFHDIKYIAKGGYGEVYQAIWTDGYITEWNNRNNNWERESKYKFVALKSLNNSKNITLEFMNEV